MNQAELDFAVWAGSEGWIVTKQGWPDFICRRGSDVMAVEVKWSDGLSRFQSEACLMLAAHGIPTYLWSPPGPLEPFAAPSLPSVDMEEARLSYWQALEIERLQSENRQLRDRLAQHRREANDRIGALTADAVAIRDDLAYLIRRAEWEKERTNRLRAIFRRYPDALLGVRPGVRRQRASMSEMMSTIATSDGETW